METMLHSWLPPSIAVLRPFAFSEASTRASGVKGNVPPASRPVVGRPAEELADRLKPPAYAKLSLQTGSYGRFSCCGTAGTLVRLDVELMRCASTNALNIASARSAWRASID